MLSIPFVGFVEEYLGRSLYKKLSLSIPFVGFTGVELPEQLKLKFVFQFPLLGSGKEPIAVFTSCHNFQFPLLGS